MSRYTAKSHLLKLGRFLENTIEQSGLTVNEFAGKAGFSSSTIYQAVNAYVEMTYPTAKRLAPALNKFCGAEVTAESLLAMIEDPSPAVAVAADSNSTPEPSGLRRDPDLMAGTKILWHLQRMAAADRLALWPDLLRMAAADFNGASGQTRSIPLGRNLNMDALIQLINNKADRHGLKTVDEFASWILSTLPDQDDLHLAIQGLITILVHRELPYQDSREFRVLMPALATALGYETPSHLLDYCGLQTKSEPKSDSEMDSIQRQKLPD